MLEKIQNRFFKTCSKTGKIRGLKFDNNLFYYLLFPLIGILATMWLIIRVVPKPTRLTYPCMKVAVPISSSFLVFVTGIITSIFATRKMRNLIQRKIVSIPLVSMFAAIAMFGMFLMITGSSNSGYTTYETIVQPANQPIGEAQGIFPGRVVWVYDPDATNEDCIPNHYGHGWYRSENNNQDIIDQMLSRALREISGMSTDKAAWDTLFKYHNMQRGKGAVNYQEGEDIFLKVNFVSTWGMGSPWGNINNDFTIANNSYYAVSETSPHLVLSVLRQLVNVVGVKQEDIYIGDPLRHIYQYRYELWHSEFPDVHYMDHYRNDYGRESFTVSNTAIIDYSDRGSEITVNTDHLYTIFETCEYMLNLPVMKGHDRAGITMFAKNHFGSHTRSGAEHLHPGLVRPEGTGDPNTRFDYRMYRVQVDLLGYELFRNKSLFYLMDALWSAGMEIHPPSKWQMAPFNNDWSSSIFISHDPVAIESVGYDFLRTEYTEERHPQETNPQMPATDDYLHQAADASTWPEGIVYDPENDGTPIPSLGVHEHWNNPDDKQYSRNLQTGDGIELVKIFGVTSVEANDVQVAEKFELKAWPNPFNPSVNISYHLETAGEVDITVYNMLGQKVISVENAWQQPGHYAKNIDFSQTRLSSGNYIVRLQSRGQFIDTKICFQK